jgi:hypothetical protein
MTLVTLLFRHARIKEETVGSNITKKKSTWSKYLIPKRLQTKSNIKSLVFTNKNRLNKASTP